MTDFRVLGQIDRLVTILEKQRAILAEIIDMQKSMNARIAELKLEINKLSNNEQTQQAMRQALRKSQQHEFPPFEGIEKTVRKGSKK